MSVKRIVNITKKYLAQPFPLLDSKRSRLFLVLFCAIFATFFNHFYNPLDMQDWQYDSAFGRFIPIQLSSLVGAFTIGFTQFFLRPKLGFSTFTVLQFILWIALEFLLLTVVLYIFFGEQTVPFWGEFLVVLRHTISLSILPYFLACLLIAVYQLSKKVEAVPTPITSPLEQHVFKDENGKIALAIKPRQLLYLKSENNYTSVSFLQNEKVERVLIRSSLKKLEQELTGFPFLLRIHRSYMINLEKIASVQRIKGSFHIELAQLPDFTIKVSDSYKAIFKEQIEKNKNYSV